MKAHLLSQVLLKRFSKRGKLRVTLLYNLSSYLNAPKDSAYIDAEDALFKPIERKYGYTETRMATAFEFLDNGTLLQHPKHVESVKKFMALHYVRAAIFYLMMREEPERFEKFIKDTKLNHPQESNEIEKNKNALRHEFRKGLIKKLPPLIKQLIGKVEKHIGEYNLEIGVAPDEVDFIVGDIAVLTKSQEGKIGILSGAAVTNSVAFGMPLGPKHLVALTTNSKPTEYRYFTVKEAGNCNEKLLKQCVAEYYSLPSND